MWHIIWQISLRIFVDFQMVLVSADEVLSGNRLLELASDAVVLMEERVPTVVGLEPGT